MDRNALINGQYCNGDILPGANRRWTAVRCSRGGSRGSREPASARLCSQVQNFHKLTLTANKTVCTKKSKIQISGGNKFGNFAKDIQIDFHDTPQPINQFSR